MEAIRKRISVALDRGQAFRLFTEGINSWWPLASHSVGGKKSIHCAFEPRVGGRIFETLSDGTQALWGMVRVYAPDRRLVFSWHPGREAESAQEVEVLFRPAGQGTEILLRHGEWDKLAEKAEETRRGYDSGWDYVLGECLVRRSRVAYEKGESK